MAKKKDIPGSRISHEEFMDHLSYAERELVPTIMDGLEVAGARAVKEMDRYFVMYPMAEPGINMNERSGSLRGSLGFEFDDSASKKKRVRLKAGVLPEGKIQRIAYLQEYGTKRFPIRPRYAKKLAIPVAHGLNPDGTRRWNTLWDADHFYGKLVFTEDEVYGKRGKFMELIAERRDEVTIEGKHFVQRGGDAIVAKTERDLTERLAHVLRLWHE